MKNYIFVLFIGLFLSGCTGVIDVQPENSTTFTNYFKAKKDAEALLVTMHSSLRDVIFNDVYGPHHAAGAILDQTSASSVTAARNLDPSTHANQVWRYYYETINSADIIIDNIHRFPFPAEEMEPYRLQACFAKGLMYFMLAQRFGEVPITRGSTNFDKLGKSSVSDVLDEAEKWALQALDLQVFEELRDEHDKPRETKQYASKGAAAALLAHLYAWRAGVEGKEECWEKAEKYCTMIINKEVGFYDLVESPEQICTEVFARNSVETIWEAYKSTEERMASKFYFSEDFFGFPVRMDSWGGNPAKKLSMEIEKMRVRMMYDEADRRRDAFFLVSGAENFYVLKNGDEYTVKTSIVEGEVVYKQYKNTYTKAFPTKFRKVYYNYTKDQQEPTFVGFDMCKVHWRLADIILLRAECRARQNKQSAIEDLNRIRKRAYGDDNHGYDASEGDLRLAIFREREKELIFEDHRYYDVVRNGLDYVRRELPEAYTLLSDQEIADGALYYATDRNAFKNNDLMRQNKYWNQFLQ